MGAVRGKNAIIKSRRNTGLPLHMNSAAVSRSRSWMRLISRNFAISDLRAGINAADVDAAALGTSGLNQRIRVAVADHKPIQFSLVIHTSRLNNVIAVVVRCPSAANIATENRVIIKVWIARVGWRIYRIVADVSAKNSNLTFELE